MRAVSEALRVAIEENPTYKMLIKAFIEPSRIFFTGITVNNPISGADPAGINDDAIPQCVGVSTVSNELVTFYNIGGVIAYSIQGSSTLTTTSQAITGNPSINQDRIFYGNSTTSYFRNIDWDLIAARDTSPWGAATPIATTEYNETILAVHAVSYTRIIALTDGDGGFSPYVMDATSGKYFTSQRFMFPSGVDLLDGVAQTMASMGIFSGGLELNGKVFLYVSNRHSGSVEGIYWSELTQNWSDIFTAVPTNLQDSFCEFRVSNCYTHNGTAYMAGQFHRTELVGTAQVYSMILQSRDGMRFGMDRFVSTSSLGYRFHATVANAKLWLGDCNRVCFSNITWVFNGVEGSNHLSFLLTKNDILSFGDSSLQSANLSLRAGDDTLIDHAYIMEGNRVRVHLGYEIGETPVEGNILVSQVGVGKSLNLWNGSSNDPEPENWQYVGFNDSGWETTSISTYPPALTGTQSVRNGSVSMEGQQRKHIIRHAFTLAELSDLRLQLRVEDWLPEGVYINGVQVAGPITTGAYGANYNSVDMVISADDLVVGDNMLAMVIQNEGGFAIGTSYRLDSLGFTSEDFVLYGTYIIDRIPVKIKDGVREVSLELVQESEWKLNGLSSPFYVEIFGKSSFWENTQTMDTGNLYVAAESKFAKTNFYADFWKSEPFDHTGEGVTGVNILEDGGVNPYEATGAHKLGVITSGELTDILGIDELPEITDATVTVRLHGWSKGDGGPNDTVECVMWLEDAEGDDFYEFTSGSGSWPDAETGVGGTYPIEVSFTGQTVGYKIKKIGLVFEAGNTTTFCPTRIEVISGVRVATSFEDANTPWIKTEKSGLELPGMNRPYVMFAQKPYNVWNFQVAGSFDHDVEGVDVDYPSAVGLVGLAEDGLNYICGRYNRTVDRVQIVKVRDGVETVLTSSIPTLDPVPTANLGMMFEHKDGTFKVYFKHTLYTSKEWIAQSSYTWQAADGFLYTSTTAAKKVGIYGYLSSPNFKITGFSLAQDEIDSITDGIPYLPLENLVDDFPASGEARIGNNVYSYTGKYWPTPHGPYQFRQNDEYEDGFGAEIALYAATAAPDVFEGWLFAIDDGANFLISVSDFILTTTNRSRHYSLNEQIGKTAHSTSNKVWLTGGLTGVTHKSGEDTRHLLGDVCALNMTGTVSCKRFQGSGGEADVTMADLIDQISALCTAHAGFPGDVIDESLAVSGETAVGTLDYVDGLDLYFETSGSPDLDIKIEVVSSIVPADTHLIIGITSTGGNYIISLTSSPSNTLIERYTFQAATAGHFYRVILHENFITVYLDGRWLYTFHLEEITYPIEIDVAISGSFNADNVRLRDLSDWREAIYIDLETDGKSALSNIIQERPIELAHRSDGSIDYWYERVRDVVTSLLHPRDHSWVRSVPRESASDTIIYGTKEVKTLQFSPFHVEIGFSTRVYRFPNISAGMVKAARVVLERLHRNQVVHKLELRPDLRVELGDTLLIEYIASATGREADLTLIPEQIDVSYQNNNQTMTITGSGKN